jgi:hypothetical protein
MKKAESPAPSTALLMAQRSAGDHAPHSPQHNTHERHPSPDTPHISHDAAQRPSTAHSNATTAFLLARCFSGSWYNYYARPTIILTVMLLPSTTT